MTAVWDAATVYARGDRVLFDGLPYQARWSTKGDAPSTGYPIGPDEPWQILFTVPGEPVTNWTFGEALQANLEGFAAAGLSLGRVRSARVHLTSVLDALATFAARSNSTTAFPPH